MRLPKWAEANWSDPGTTLVEVFAFLAEEIGHRRRRVAVGALFVAALIWLRRRDGNDDD